MWLADYRVGELFGVGIVGRLVARRLDDVAHDRRQPNACFLPRRETFQGFAWFWVRCGSRL